MCVCVYIYMHAGRQACIYVCMHTHKYRTYNIYIYVCVVYAHIHKHTHAHTLKHMHMHIHIRFHMHQSPHAHVHTQTQTEAYTHACTRRHTHTRSDIHYTYQHNTCMHTRRYIYMTWHQIPSPCNMSRYSTRTRNHCIALNYAGLRYSSILYRAFTCMHEWRHAHICGQSCAVTTHDYWGTIFTSVYVSTCAHIHI